ncbi:MAG: class I SAM-dependent methyltransferase [Verrucomicrobia bacterium]|jgi:SAM-dependent methyltransferase|nr:class I SAM-dependent methyltransferase [Verrucomicrobiota bacterium]
MSPPVTYAIPQLVEDPSLCQFYHRMEIPGVGEVGGEWDLRQTIDSYLGEYDFTGQRVLDVGAATGFLTFEIERRGAREVVSFDMEDGAQWDIVPHALARGDAGAFLEQVQRGHKRLKNAYWFAHSRLGSRARAYYGDIYRMPANLGPFDVAVMGMILGHLRDPLHAIANVAALCSSHLILTNQALYAKDPLAYLMPSRENKERLAWWALSDACLKQMLRILGFEVVKVVKSMPRCLVKGREGQEECMSLVARRVVPEPA